MSQQRMAETSNYRTFVLWLLTLAYIFSFIDRQIMGALSPSIKTDLGFEDWQLGLLKGFGFALLYTTVGIPIAWLADRYSRIKIVSISVFFWSLFTAFTGMANSFLTMLLARTGVYWRGRWFTALPFDYFRPLSKRTTRECTRRLFTRDSDRHRLFIHSCRNFGGNFRMAWHLNFSRRRGSTLGDHTSTCS